MRKSKLLVSVVTLVFVLAFAGAAFANPITLPTGEVSKLKFVNYENYFDENQNSIIDAGDYFEGIVNVESITNIPGTVNLTGQLGTVELTGYFKLSVVGGLIPLGGPGHVDFALMPGVTGGGGTGDFINFYVGTGATKNWDPTGGVSGTVAEAIGYATDGALWASILAGTPYEGINDTIIGPPVSLSLNQNWADLTVNMTGYDIIPQLYPAVFDALYPGHLSFAALHGSHMSDVYFTSELMGSDVPIWFFRSEDPLYVFVPEPATLILLGAGLLGVGFARRKMKK